jgi:hypothetical protein
MKRLFCCDPADYAYIRLELVLLLPAMEKPSSVTPLPSSKPCALP